MNKIFISSLSFFAGISTFPALSGNKAPNIIFIMSDDHAAQAISAYEGILSSVFPTPNIDRLAREGMRLDNCFVTNSISTPSRAAILTGQYSQKNKVYTLGDHLSRELPNVAKALQGLGYTTVIIGKWHLGTEPNGFDYYKVLPGQGRYHDPVLIEKGCWHDAENKEGEGAPGKVYEGHSTDVITNEAISYLERVDKNAPFFLMCHFKAPHRPWQPADRFKDLLKDVDIPEPANLLDTYEGKGAYTAKIRMGLEYMNKNDLKGPVPTTLSRDEFRHWAYQIYIKDYLRCVAGIDENVGRILQYLDDNHLTENTIVIYTGDQGFFLGEHGWFDKRLMYEECLRMPFLIRYPKEIPAGKVNKDMVLNIDFAPLFLDYAGIKQKPGYMQGESFRENLSGRTPCAWRKSMYYRYWMHGDGAHNATANYGIRTERYKLIYYYARPLGKVGTHDDPLDPEWELYDLKDDPMEMRNIYHDPENKALVRELKSELIRLKEMYGDRDSSCAEMKNLNSIYFW